MSSPASVEDRPAPVFSVKLDQFEGPLDGVAARLGVHALEPEPVGILVLGVDTLRHRNDFGEDVELFGHARPTAEQHVDDLLEIEQPERQFEGPRADDARAVAEAGGVLVVHVQQEDAHPAGIRQRVHAQRGM